ncbi:hypothetical protein D3C73_848670 [compost metagenome]
MLRRGDASYGTAFDQTVGTTFGYTAFDQAIRATFGYTAFDQAIRATFGYAAFDQAIRATFSNNWLSGGGGKCVNCENRESDAEEDLAFHDGVLRGVIGWYGADVTPHNFYENFIEVMVTIDADNARANHTPL